MNPEELKELTETTARSKHNTQRIDNLEKEQALMYEMNKNLAVIAERTQDTRSDVQTLKNDVEEIKSKPNKLLDSIVVALTTGIVGLIVGALMAQILL